MTRTRPRLRLDITRRLVHLAIASAILTACTGDPGAIASSAGGGSAVPEAGALKVVATTTVFADLVANVGGPKVAVTSLVPKGGEVHTFDPTPSDVRRIAEAGLVVMNGLGLDEWIAQIVSDSGSTAPIIELAEDLEGVTYLEGGEEHLGEGPSAESGHDETFNPHLWLDVENAQRYVDRIVDGLVSADPDDAATFEANGAAYRARLGDLDAWVHEQIGTIPAANRKLVSFHEAFPYFAAAYGLEIVGTIVEAPGQDPSAGEIVTLVEAIKASGAKAVFTEAQFSPELAQTVAAEAGVAVVSDLYNDSLGDPPVDSYEAMIRWDTDKTVEALR